MQQVFKGHQLCKQDSPLGSYIDPYAAEMRREGYPQQSIELQSRLIADFSQWLAKRRITAKEVSAELFQPYLRVRARRRSPTGSEFRALRRLLHLLVREGVVPEPAPPTATPAGRLVTEFRFYLRQERALASTTQSYYLTFVSEFLRDRFGGGPVDLSCLCARDVTGFVQRRAAPIRSRRVQLMTTALRSFLQFARYRGDIDKDLAACVPAVANWKQSTIPRAIPAHKVKLLLDSIDRKTGMGRRDYAILLLLARLGLRAGEIKALKLEDFDWKEGLIKVCGKGGRYAQLPLPTDVGEAIADYLRNGRSNASSRCVFLRVRAPIDGFQGQCGIGSVVRHTLARAGVDAPRKGAHQFRHGLASQMLQHGASLSEIGELLRHRSPQTTAIYAKVDLASLSTLALPWPGGAQ
jgi:site-specific recombinase XerD